METQTLNNSPKPPHNNLWRWVIALAAILIAFSYGAYYLHGHKKNNQPSLKTEPAIAINIGQAKTYSLGGPGNGSGLKFYIPSGFESIAPPSDSSWHSQALLDQSSNARIAAASQQFTLPGPDYFDNYQKSLNDVNHPDYNAAIKPIGEFVAARLPSGYKLAALSQPRPYTNDNIQQNAWIAGIAASSASKPPALMTGQIIVAFGQATRYQFMVLSTISSWQLNAATWQKVNNSFKIDQ